MPSSPRVLLFSPHSALHLPSDHILFLPEKISSTIQSQKAAMSVTSMAISSVEAILGYKFTDTNCLLEALNAPGSGVSTAGNRRFSDGNKRLALKGDAAIRNVIVEDWFSTNLPRGKVPVRRKACPAADTEYRSHCGQYFAKPGVK